MYEIEAGSVTNALTTASPAFTSDTIAKIIELTTGTGDTKVTALEVTAPANGNVTVAAGTEIAYVTAPSSGNVQINADIPVVLLQGTTGVQATFASTGAGSADGVVDRVVVGTAGSDKIVIDDAKNSLVTIGDGDTVVAGAGSDTIVAGMGDSTVEGGEGYAIVQLTGDRSDYTVTVGANGEAIIAGQGSTTTITGIQYVALENGDALILATNEVEAAVSTLYETTFGRAADAYGLEYWFQLAHAGVDLNTIAQGFVSSNEYATTVGNVDNSTFVNNLFKQTYGHEASAAQIAEWTAKMASGSDRADLLEQFAAAAAELIADGSGSEVVGSVTIIPGTFG